jgi:hypothetical protein
MERLADFFVRPHCHQPLDSNHHFKVLVVVVNFAGKWVTVFGYPAYPQKKAAGALCAQLSVGLSNDLVRLLALNREQGSNRYSRLRAYYKGFDPELTYYNYLNQKLWKSLSKFNPMPGSSVLTYPSKALMYV